MRTLAMLAAASGLLAAPTLAQSPDRATGPAGALVGNHIEVSYGGGPVAMRSSFAADGTFRLTAGDTIETGDWVADDRYVCWIRREPRPTSPEGFRCEANETEGRSPGDTWTQVDSDGQTANVTLRAGPHTP